MARRNNVVMRKSNDNSDHKNMVTTWIIFADEVKHFSGKHCIFLLLWKCLEQSTKSTWLCIFKIYTLFGHINSRALFTLRCCINSPFFHTLIPKFQLQFPKKYLKRWTELLQICTTSMIYWLLVLYFLSNFLTLFCAFLHRWSNVTHAIWWSRKWESFHCVYIYISEK